ncbi:hypothetical protein S40285_06599 [Stachybotrys chlorohalonatus IBT 40285]|uniref:HMG box domain-containing protein n=1 Tax=Stachybotrys chlorohalonatus (strain IBT 40285) TaxID=1283841 RepID=A0A084QHH8_STAC4|nr:hypothetical protein S40285_06599 [Stachybotrys chlorohalonata IBT 40285]
MPSRKSLSATDTASAAPPSLPPSVEEAYRRKCVQLKNRTNEVEDANDAARLRLARIKRQVEKLRIERAFLLEQLAKRTSANVEDSEGSPSPPPTEKQVDLTIGPVANPRKPKDRPLRTKRGHRKTSNAGEGDTPDAKPSNSKQPGSPGSESVPADGKEKGAARANGVGKAPKKPSNAFELYCEEVRDDFTFKIKETDLNLEEELARGWKDLPEDLKEEFQAKHDKEMERYREEKEAQAQSKESQADTEKPETQDEDVEMGNYDTEDQETQEKEADD